MLQEKNYATYLISLITGDFSKISRIGMSRLNDGSCNQSYTIHCATSEGKKIFHVIVNEGAPNSPPRVVNLSVDVGRGETKKITVGSGVVESGLGVLLIEKIGQNGPHTSAWVTKTLEIITAIQALRLQLVNQAQSEFGELAVKPDLVELRAKEKEALIRYMWYQPRIVEYERSIWSRRNGLDDTIRGIDTWRMDLAGEEANGVNLDNQLEIIEKRLTALGGKVKFIYGKIGELKRALEVHKGRLKVVQETLNGFLGDVAVALAGRSLTQNWLANLSIKLSNEIVLVLNSPKGFSKLTACALVGASVITGISVFAYNLVISWLGN